MKTIELDFDKQLEISRVGNYIRKGRIKIGREPVIIRIFISHSVSDDAYASYLLLLVEYLFNISRSKPGLTDEGKDFEKRSSRLFSLYFKNYNIAKLENAIEKELKVDIELERKNPADAVFGIWKNEKINLENIREGAWQRTK